jgi:spoIIIJ-associated protein
MKSIEKSARTVDEAVNLACQELGVDRATVEYVVVDPGSKGVLGLFGGKEATVRVTLPDNPGEDAVAFLRPIFEKLKVHPSHKIEKKDDSVWVSFAGSGLGAIIGRRGETLDALQYLTNLAVNRRFEEKTRIILDVEGYRKSREETLSRLARKMADKARRSGKDVMLEPMSPHERRIIHMALQDEPGVKTFSLGEEPYRKVVIKKVNGEAE